MKIILSILFSILLSSSLFAQEEEWSYNPNKYRYDMTIYAGITVNNRGAANISNYKIGAFCGDECRGILQVKTINGIKYGYLRVRSNVESGEHIDFRIIDLNDQKSYTYDGGISFMADSYIGMPSNPLLLNIIDIATLTGNVNGDDRISIADIVTLIHHCNNNTTDLLDKVTSDTDNNNTIDINDIDGIVRILLLTASGKERDGITRP